MCEINVVSYIYDADEDILSNRELVIGYFGCPYSEEILIQAIKKEDIFALICFKHPVEEKEKVLKLFNQYADTFINQVIVPFDVFLMNTKDRNFSIESLSDDDISLMTFDLTS